MALKRSLIGGGGDGSDHLNKRSRLFSTVLRGTNHARIMQETVPYLEPLIRKWVQEAIEDTIGRNFRSMNNQIECSGSRPLQLQFQSSVPHTLFTGSKIMSDDRTPITIALYDSSSGQIVTSGPLSSTKVNIVVLDGDFGPDREDWKKIEFERKIVQNREGKRPLVTGELTVTLQGGVGYIGEVSFTDNSSWIRSGRFRLGAKVHNGETNVREGLSNSFKVKDHRGESYQKHYPPSLDDEVWRLEKIAKDGASHNRLTKAGVKCVRDFLRLFFKDHFCLRKLLGSMSNKIWETITRHALTCTLNDEMYMYSTTQGLVLFFNAVHKLVGVTFNGESYLSMDRLNMFQMRIVEALKPHAYKKTAEWVSVCDQSTFDYPMILPSPANIGFDSPPQFLTQDADFQVEQDQMGVQMNAHHLATSPPSYHCDTEQNSGSFELGESSNQGQEFDRAFGNYCGMSNFPGDYYMGSFIGTHLSTGDQLADDNFQVDSPAWKGNGLFLGSGNHEIGILPSSNTGIPIPRKNRSPRAQWCKILAVVKWRILVKRDVAARKWKEKSYYNYS